MRDNQAILVSIILVNYNGAEVVVNCLRSLEQSLHTIPYETIVVDNASTDGSADMIATNFPQVHLIRQPENRGFGAGNNAGATVAKGEFLFLLNTDTLLSDDVLPHLVTCMKDHPKAGIVGPKLLNVDGSLQLSTAHEISILGEFRTQQQYKKIKSSGYQKAILYSSASYQEVDIVIGAAFFIRKHLFDKLGGFDETFFMYFEESDLCKRAKNSGWKIFYISEAAVTHLGGYSVNKTVNLMSLAYRRSQLYYYQKHRPLWEQIVLRVYLLIKFSLAYIRSSNSINLKIIASILDFKHYPIRAANTIKLSH